MSEWRYIECDMCGAKSEPSVYPILHYRLEGWTHERDPDPAIMGSDYCPTCSVEDEPEQPDTFVYYALDDAPEWTI